MTRSTDSDDRAFAATDRRLFLRRGLQLGGAVLLGGPLLAACGDSDSSSSASSGSKGFGELTLRLSWIKNVEFAGSYIADSKGYYTAEGFSKVTLIGGGPSATPMETDVVTKKALVAISAPDITGAAVAKGAPLKIIGAQYQKNPFCIMSMTKAPITKPEDMYGKKIGVQAGNESVWAAYIKATGLDESKITKVPVQFDPLPLTQGTVDGWFSFVTNEPNTLRLKGFKVSTMLLADTGYPLVSETYCVRQDTIDKHRDLLKAFLRAEIKGWKASIADPALGAKLAAETYGKGLGLTTEEQTLEAADENKLLVTADTKKNGLFTITPELVEENIKTLKYGGLDITADKLFDLSIIEEVYKENPSLI
ncbi:ABC transporter substrate-binding protein [Streptomyces sp. NRRL WC-3618]|uniref:ABC transporter substrate-binding protein n=1 Tax=Streptomyces sp. NRRL WC-3618 TaxID=1519490 RepID=UPI0006AE810D|nr:ABC transporter substrate-binding protein [Streptomyces sp. NRRL WC-3618]KOV86633.1 ABC transporter substrate-binding protein [Streptomyces sp. NRRL WC-3618]